MSNPKEHRESASPAIAVVGVSALFPGSNDVRTFWRNIVEGRDQITEIPPNYWLIEDYYDPDPAAPDKTYGKRGAFLSEVPFDAMAYGVPPNVVQQTDTSQLLGLIVAQRVLEDAAGGDFQHVDKSRISVILGATGATELVVHLGARLQRPIWLNALRANGIPEDEAQAICNRIADSYVPWTEASFPGLLGNVTAGRIANKFDLGGTNCVVDAACASSLSALAMGLSELYLQQSDMVIVGGVDTLNDILMYMCFSKTPALSVSGDCRPFSDQADGTILGEGLGMLALRRLEDAERDGDRIYAVIRGVGSSSDGKGTAVYAPKASGQAHALRRAYAAAGYSPRTVELLEAHGTATKAGDVAEFTGASSVFAEADPEGKQWCAIGSIKSQIGHTKGAAGAASLIKAVLALHHKVLPPTIKVDRPNPNLAVDESPFYINTQARPWVRDASHPRRASVSSFGFGGSNFHVTLEEYTGATGRKDEFRPSPTELFLLSGANIREIVATGRRLTEGFDDGDGFQFLARSSQLAFQVHDRLRLAIVARDLPDLRAKLDAILPAIERDPMTAQQSPAGWYYSGDGAPGHDGKLAFLFPGQGSQYVGMSADLAIAFDRSRAVWDEAANLEFEQGGHLQDVVFPQPVFSDEERATQETRLRATEWAQPAIGVASLSLLTLLAKLGIKPDAVAGHSFGEVTALHSAGALDRKAFFSVARKRGELMAEAAAMFPGAMTAISHASDAVASLLASWNTGVVIANHNSPDQVVISGIESAIHATEEKLRQAAIRFQRLPVSTAFHSAVVRPATAPFRAFLEHIAISRPLMPVYANSLAAVYSSAPDNIRDTIAGQIAEPVRFAEQIEAMYAAGVRTFVEVGPGAVLTNLVKSSLADRPHRAVALDRKGQHGLTSLWQGLAQLAVAGVSVAMDRLWDGVAYGDDPRTRKTPKLAVNLSGVNYAKPYPPVNGAAGRAAPNPVRNGYHAPVNELPAKPEKTAGANGHYAPVAAPTRLPTAPATQSAPVSLPVAPAAFRPSSSPQTLPGQTPAQTVSAPPAAVQPLPAPPPTSQPQPQPAPIAPSPVASLPAGAATGESLAWVSAFQTIQQQTVDAHMAFLHVADQSMRSLETMLTLSTAGGGMPAWHEPAAPAAPARTPAPTNGVAAVAYAAPAPERLPAVSPAPVAALLPVVFHAKPASAAQTPAAAPSQSPIHQSPIPQSHPVVAPPAVDLHAVMMAVVTEKTGYPTEMLEPGMALDTDLGIDSIKRVEILAAVRERVPVLPEFETSVMAGLRTLGEIVAYMDAQLGQTPAAALPDPFTIHHSPFTIHHSSPDPVRRYVLEMTPRPAPGLTPPFLIDGTLVYITDDGAGVAPRLAERLRQAGAQATVVATVPPGARAVICLAGLRTVGDEDAALAANEEAFRLATTIAAGFEAEGGLFVTVQDTGGDFGLYSTNGVRAWLGGLSGLAKTAAQEWPGAVVRTLDVAAAQRSPAAVADCLADELLNGAADREIGLPADGGRYAFVSSDQVAAGGSAVVTPESVIVVSGGGRGVTAAAIVELAKTAHPRIALLGRSTLEEEPAAFRTIHDDAGLKKALLAAAQATGQRLTPRELGAAAERILAAREIRATVQALQTAGSEAVYLPCDITDPVATAATLDQVRALWGPITGIVHGAGVLADKRLAEKSGDDFRRVFGTKIGGLRALLAATAGDPLTVICLFSSVAARTGNAGQSDYAMANEVLNRVANELAHHHSGCVVKSIGWGPWAGGMVTPLLKAKFDELGVPLIPLASGARHFVAELQQAARTEVEVVIGGLPQAGPLLNPQQAQRTQPAHFDVLLSAATAPYLFSHQVNGVAVVPLVMVQEWFLRAAAAFAPGGDQATLPSLHKLRVRKGIPLPAFGDQPVRLRIHIEADASAPATFNATLYDGDGGVRFTAQVVNLLPGSAETSRTPAETGETWPVTALVGAELYGVQLFHGPAFATLQRIDRLGERGARAELAGSRSVGWDDLNSRSDPALIDAGLQLARVWGHALLKQLTLPTTIEAFILHEPGLLAAERTVRCIVEGKAIGQSGTRSTVWYIDEQSGGLVAEVRGLEMYVSSEAPLVPALTGRAQ
jgi:malonyl CoA-acyl carrier protein transacylase